MNKMEFLNLIFQGSDHSGKKKVKMISHTEETKIGLTEEQRRLLEELHDWQKRSEQTFFEHSFS